MLSAGGWRRNQPNTVLFVLIDNSGIEVTGAVFDVWITKAGGAFALGLGVATEIGLGWYSYTSTAAEADTPGPVGLAIIPVSALQQNLEYVVDDRVVTAITFTYTVTSTVGGNPPISDVKVSIYSEVTAVNLIWKGVTDSFGIARDTFGQLPRLEAGTYYLWRDRVGYSFQNPDVETVE